jgi:hypothetical protein
MQTNNNQNENTFYKLTKNVTDVAFTDAEIKTLEQRSDIQSALRT